MAMAMVTDPAPAAAAVRMRCRPIVPGDAPAIADLLADGFPDRTPAYWARAIDRLIRHGAGLAVPGTGVVLQGDDAIVGVLLLIPSAGAPDGTARARCNVSSWFVDPRFAAYGSLLVHQALRRKDVTYFNISPAPHTRATIEAQGFARYSRGRLLVPAVLMPWRPGVSVRLFDPTADAALLGQADTDRLVRHVGYGCLALVVTTPEGAEPFLFLPWTLKGVLASAQLIYCRDIAGFTRLAGPLGRFLLRHGLPLVTVDLCDETASEPAGLRITDRSPKYARGGPAPRTGDLTDTELVMFGP
jgi:hypothetical protein